MYQTLFDFVILTRFFIESLMSFFFFPSIIFLIAVVGHLIARKFIAKNKLYYAENFLVRDIVNPLWGLLYMWRKTPWSPRIKRILSIAYIVPLVILLLSMIVVLVMSHL